MRRAFVFTFLFATACSSSMATRPASIAKPTILVQQAGNIYFGSGDEAPVSVNIQVTNNAAVPLRIREVEITSPGMMQYSVPRVSKLFNETVAPGETRVVGMVASAIARQARVDRYEPLSLRAVIRFEGGGKDFREIVFQQIAGEGAQ